MWQVPQATVSSLDSCSSQNRILPSRRFCSVVGFSAGSVGGPSCAWSELAGRNNAATNIALVTVVIGCIAGIPSRKLDVDLPLRCVSIVVVLSELSVSRRLPSQALDKTPKSGGQLLSYRV